MNAGAQSRSPAHGTLPMFAMSLPTSNDLT